MALKSQDPGGVGFLGLRSLYPVGAACKGPSALHVFLAKTVLQELDHSKRAGLSAKATRFLRQCRREWRGGVVHANLQMGPQPETPQESKGFWLLAITISAH